MNRTEELEDKECKRVAYVVAKDHVFPQEEITIDYTAGNGVEDSLLKTFCSRRCFCPKCKDNIHYSSKIPSKRQRHR